MSAVRAEHRLHRWLALGLIGLSLPSVATPPLMDYLEIGEEAAPLYGTPIKRGFPWSPKLQEVARQSMLCSAIGAPRGRYRLHEGQVWLVGFIRCGPDLGLDEAYGRPTQPLPAVWLSGDLHVGQGKLLCYEPWGESIWQTRVELKLERGQVMQQRSLDQSGHPRLPAGSRLPGGSPGPCRER